MTMTRRSRQILTKFNIKGHAFTKLRNLDLRTSDDKDEQWRSFDSSQNVSLQRHDTKQVKTNTKQQRLMTNEVADTQSTSQLADKSTSKLQPLGHRNFKLADATRAQRLVAVLT